MRCFRFFIIVLFSLASADVLAQYKLYESGLDAYKQQEYDNAIRLFSEYFSKPGRDKKIDVEVYYYRGLAYYKKEDYKSAIPDLQEAAKLQHTNTGNIHWFIAKCHQKLGDHHKAVSEYSNAIFKLKNDKAAHAKLLFERGQIYEQLNNPTAAYDDFVLAANLNVDDQSIREELDKLVKSNPSLASRKNSVTEQQLATSTQPSVAKETGTEKKGDVKTQGNRQNNDVAKNTTQPKGNQSVTRNDEVKVVPETQTATNTFLTDLAATYKNEKRYALVIGNGNYPKSIGALRNPVNDAADFAKKLQESNFDVQLLTNVTYIQMREAMRKFNQKLTEGPKDETVGLFYFAGHGVAHDEENYLVPIDAAVEFEDDIPRMCFPVQRMVLANMERTSSRMNIVILDACRNNPFPSATRSIGHGLAEMGRARGSFIAYATAPGSVASDGTGRNGLYTQELLRAIDRPGRTIEQVFKEVRANVLKLTEGKQNTWDSSNIVGEFYFKFQ
jgi:tetratricopeptide (TPR) repeat protein